MDVRAMNQVEREAPLLMRRRQEDESLRRPRIVIAAGATAVTVSGRGGSVSLGSSATSASVTVAAATPDKTQGDVAAHLKKQRRNERDRHRSLLKRESMKKMRAMVAQLESQKRKLLAMLPSPTGEYEDQEEATREPEAPTSPVGDDSSALRRQEFVRLAAEIEALRKANAALAASLRERDMFNSAMQNLMLEFDHPVDLSEIFDDDDDDDCHHNTEAAARQALTGDVAFTPLTMEEAQETVRATLQQMTNARAVHLSDANFEHGAKFFGWSEFTYRKQATISFALKKSLPNTVPRALLATTWSFVTDSKNTSKLIRPQLSAKYTPLQMLGPDMIVIDRRTEDPCRVGINGKPLAMRTIYLLFWTKVPATDDGDDGSQDAYVLAMKTIDLPLVKRMLRDDELWCDIFYWIRFAPDGKVVDTSDGGTSATLAEFGGVNTYVREEIASSWLAELVFLAIRWETLAVAPCLLKS